MLKGKPFYRWKESKPDERYLHKCNKVDCCFNHIIGLPVKNGKEHPLYDYEHIIFKCMEIPNYENNTPGTSNPLYPHKVGRLCVLKSSGLGLTEYFLRYMSWLCVKDDKLSGSDMVIITSPRINLAQDLVLRIEKMFYYKLKVEFDSDMTTVMLNNVRIRAFPSHNISAARGIPNVSFFFVDEAAFIPDNQIREVLDVAERYAGKSAAKIVLLSTPYKPNDAMDQILSQPWNESFYKTIKFPYTWGLGKIYTEEDIKIAKASASFEKEFNNKFLGQIGDVFQGKDIDAAIALGEKMGYDVNPSCAKVMGIDPTSGGDSYYAITVLQFQDGIIQVIYAEQYPRGMANYNDMIARILQIDRECGGNDSYGINNVYCDASNPNVIQSLKSEYQEDTSWPRIRKSMADCKEHGWEIGHRMKVIPTPFNSENVRMLIHSREILETPGLIAIHPKFEELIISLRTAKSENYHLKKEDSTYNDLYDSFRLALQYFTFSKD